MRKLIVSLLFATSLATACATGSGTMEPLRIDATSVESTRASYKAMMDKRSEAQQMQLALAVLVLNMEGVKSAYEVVGNPELQAPSVERIRSKVADLTAEQIIALSKINPAVKIALPGSER